MAENGVRIVPHGEPGVARSIAADPRSNEEDWVWLMGEAEDLELTVQGWRQRGAWKQNGAARADYKAAQADLAEYRAAAASLGQRLGIG